MDVGSEARGVSIIKLIYRDLRLNVLSAYLSNSYLA